VLVQLRIADDQRQHAGGGQGRSASSRRGGFSRVFHAGQIKIFRRHLQFGIFSATWLPSPKGDAITTINN
jgi:hypothetical protein